MTVLLELRERTKQIYSKYEAFILPLLKFLLALVTLNTVNGRLGYMTRINDLKITLMAALACSFLPPGMLVVFAMLFSLMHMYALSMEVALVGLCIYLVLYLLYFRFSPKDSLVVALTPLLCAFGMPYVIPVAVGLLCGPSSAVSVGCGLVVFYFLQMVIESAPNIRIMGEDAMMDKIRMLVETLLGNKAMLVMIAAFAITVLVVYLIRRMPIDYSWTIAMIAGAMLNVVVLLIGDLLYDIKVSVGGALFGSILAVAVAKVIEFFRFCVDYGRIERVQFEDDEYYYYVKAVPKMTVAAPEKTVKRITTQRTRGTGGSVKGTSSRQTAGTAGRHVTTERTAVRTGSSRTSARSQGRGERSVTIGNAYEDEIEDIDVAEEEFSQEQYRPAMSERRRTAVREAAKGSRNVSGRNGRAAQRDTGRSASSDSEIDSSDDYEEW